MVFVHSFVVYLPKPNVCTQSRIRLSFISNLFAYFAALCTGMESIPPKGYSMSWENSKEGNKTGTIAQQDAIWTEIGSLGTIHITAKKTKAAVTRQTLICCTTCVVQHCCTTNVRRVFKMLCNILCCTTVLDVYEHVRSLLYNIRHIVRCDWLAV